MSTDSANQFSLEDNGSITETPPQSIQKCTRGSPCSRPDCLSCTGPTNNGHVRDLTEDLEVTLVKLTSPPNHWTIRMIKVFEEAIQDQDPNELKMAQALYQKQLDAVTFDELDYDRTEVKQLNRDAKKLLTTLLDTPIQIPNPPPLPTPSNSLKMNKLDPPPGQAKHTIFTVG